MPSPIFFLAILLCLSPEFLLALPQSSLPIDQAVRVILEKNCLACHGETRMSGLDLRQRATIIKGGSKGAAVIPGKAGESLLYLVASHKGEPKMPPGKPPVSPEDLEILKEWIDQGVPWSDTDASSDQAAKAIAILQKHCLTCHGAAQLSKLDMRQRESILKGGERGPALIPGKAEESLLYQAASHKGQLKMPLGKPPIPQEDLEVLKTWIDRGAPWSTVAQTNAPDASWWSFREPKRPIVPTTRNENWIRTPIDAFILANLEQKQLKPAPQADKRTLIRRAYFDLIGLPPTPKQVETFVKDTSPNSYERLIDQLLASPQYGERWGRRWLDVARYADSGGYETDIYYPNAWRYRDYVIKSFNDDKPYDRFLQEQIAGDELWPDNIDLHGSYKLAQEKLEHLEARIGTGFYTLGPEVHESNMDAKKLLYEKLSDSVDTTGAAFLGLTVGCARCHDHKFDPIPQRDYYRLQAIFAESKQVEIPVIVSHSIADYKRNYPKILGVVERRVAYRLFEEKVKQRIIQTVKAKYPPDVVQAYDIAEEKRTTEQQRLAMPLAEAIKAIKMPSPDGDSRWEQELTSEEKQDQRKLLEQTGQALLALPETDGLPGGLSFYDGLMDIPSASVLGHHDSEFVPEIYVLNRGDLGHEKEKVSPGLLTALDDGTLDFEPSLSGGLPRRTRKKLALWLSRPDHPLTSRVMVNRIWQWHFGRGIVSSPNDFGRRGQLPSHPELLDWLATEFVESGWSIKQMHRSIMLSTVYQMASEYHDEKNARTDPDNQYLWRMNRQRLEGEVLWDAMHAVAGTLNLKMGGRPVAPPLAEDELTALGSVEQWPVSADPKEHNRRGIYIVIRRNFTYPMFEAFDSPDNAVSCPERDVTMVAPQALWFLNNKIAFQQAQEFASRLVTEWGTDPKSWVDNAWLLALGRLPSDREKRAALELMDSLMTSKDGVEKLPDFPIGLAALGPSRAAALTKFCLSLFNLSEFVFID